VEYNVNPLNPKTEAGYRSVLTAQEQRTLAALAQLVKDPYDRAPKNQEEWSPGRGVSTYQTAFPPPKPTTFSPPRFRPQISDPRKQASDGVEHDYNYGMFSPTLTHEETKHLAEAHNKPFLFVTYAGTSKVAHPAGASLFRTYGGERSLEITSDSPHPLHTTIHAPRGADLSSFMLNGTVPVEPTEETAAQGDQVKPKNPWKGVENYLNALKKKIPPA